MIYRRHTGIAETKYLELTSLVREDKKCIAKMSYWPLYPIGDWKRLKPYMAYQYHLRELERTTRLVKTSAISVVCVPASN